MNIDTFQAIRNEQQQRAQAKQRKEARNLEQFEAKNPQFAGWWTNSTFPFAVSLREAVMKYGDLTERQMEAAIRCIEKFNAARNAYAERVAAAPAVDSSRVVTALKKASATLLSPKLRLLADEHEFVFSFAPSHGKNAGAVYVKEGETYLGKVMNGAFQRSRDCSTDIENAVLVACNNPEQTAIAYGKKFGVCGCCGRTLTNPESIEYGIGPICRGKFF